MCRKWKYLDFVFYFVIQSTLLSSLFLTLKCPFTSQDFQKILSSQLLLFLLMWERISLYITNFLANLFRALLSAALTRNYIFPSFSSNLSLEQLIPSTTYMSILLSFPTSLSSIDSFCNLNHLAKNSRLGNFHSTI